MIILRSHTTKRKKSHLCISIPLERNYPLGEAKQKISEIAGQILNRKEYSRLRFIPDVDPQ
ncbi:MAG: hypothetical protein J5605_05455 [Bacteroidales bacterium]|nr:hypothetical protein [Bacteroidales bacterium]